MGILGGDPPKRGEPRLSDAGPRFILVLVLSHCPWAASMFMLLPRALETSVKMGVGGGRPGVGAGLCPSAHCCPPPWGAGLELWQPREEGSHSVSWSSEPMVGA